MKTKRTPRYEPTEVNGVVKQSLAGYDEERIPSPPRNPRQQAQRAMFTIAVGFTVLAMAVSAAAIGHLFSMVITPWVAYPAAALFDGLWIFALLGEWLAAQRRQRRAQRAAQGAGAVFMVASMGAIVAEAHLLGYLVVGVFLALVPAAVKGGWWLWFEITKRPDLPLKWADRLADDRAELSVQLEVAEDQYELEAHRARLTELRRAHNLAHPVEGDGYRIVRVTGADQQEVSEKVTELVSSSAQKLKAQRMAQLSELLSREPELTPAQVMSELDVSLATAKRYLTQARRGLTS